MTALSPSAPPSELDIYNIDKYTNKEIKSSEQLKRHSLDWHLSEKPIDRALHLLSVGEEVQRLSVVQSLPELLSSDAPGCMQKIVPKIQQTLPSGSTEYHMMTSQAVKDIIQKNMITPDIFVNVFLQTIITSIDNRDPAVADTWIETLLDIMDLLPVKVIQSEIAPLAIARSQMAKTVPVRISSCRLLGHIAKRYDGQLVRKDLLGTVTSLCQDVNEDVRACMCSQLATVTAHMGDALTQSTLLPCIIELATDEVSKVKEAAFTTIVDILDVFNTDVVKFTLIPMLKQLISYALKSNEYLLVTIAKHFGKMCLRIERALPGSEKEEFVRWYTALSQLGLQTKRAQKSKLPEDMPSHSKLASENYTLCREYCAYNFPAMAKFCQSDNQLLVKILRPAFSDLVGDTYYMVRRTIASGMLQVLTIYGSKCADFKNDFVSLLKEETEDVLEAFIPNIAEIIAHFTKNGLYGPEDSSLAEMMRALVKCESVMATSHNWRTHSLLFKQFESLHKVFSSDSLYNNFVTMLFKRINTCRAVPVRLAAVRTLLVYLRYIQKPQHKSDMRNKLINDVCCSSNFYDRMLFVRSCNTILEMFSTSYFKEHFFVKTVSLLDDPVANMRWATCRLLPRLKVMAKVGPDKNLTHLLESALERINHNEQDTEVLRIIDEIQPILDKPPDFTKMFPNDQRKYEEEKLLAIGGEGQVKDQQQTGGIPSQQQHSPTTPGGGRFGQGTSVVPRRFQNQSQSSAPSSGPSSSGLNQGQTQRSQPNRTSIPNTRTTNSSGQRQPENNTTDNPGQQQRLSSYQQKARYNNNTTNNSNSNTGGGGSPRKTQQHWQRKSEGIGIPIRKWPVTPTMNDTTNPTIIKTNQYHHKRHSLEVVADLDRTNNNTSSNTSTNSNTSRQGGELMMRRGTSVRGGRQRQSHLPRPLSCINFSIKALENVTNSTTTTTRPADARYQRRT